MTVLVAITGGIGSGKSTFSKEVLKRNFDVLDSDEQVAQLYKKPTKDLLDYLKKIHLGDAIKNKKINKGIIANKIFSDKKIKLKLEKYIFHIVRKKRHQYIKRQKKAKAKIAFFDIPLLFENNLSNNFDIIISIISSRKIRAKRLKISNKISQTRFKNIIRNQTSDVIRKKNADFIIYNNGTLNSYLKKINNILDSIIK
tara:strand:- start:344 stop:940 length:597 start_codon:yes stop_codon:yes gene_type:complete